MRLRILLEFASTIHTGREEENQAQKHRKSPDSHKLRFFATYGLKIFFAQKLDKPICITQIKKELFD